MRFQKNISVLMACVVLFAGIITVCLSGTLFGREDRFEVRHEITTPAYRTDMDRMMDAYQQLMNNYIRLTEKNLSGLNTDVQAVQAKLNAMDVKMTELSAQLTRIEKHLGIKPPEKTPPTPEQPKKEDQ